MPELTQPMLLFSVVQPEAVRIDPRMAVVLFDLDGVVRCFDEIRALGIPG